MMRRSFRTDRHSQSEAHQGSSLRLLTSAFAIFGAFSLFRAIQSRVKNGHTQGNPYVTRSAGRAETSVGRDVSAAMLEPLEQHLARAAEPGRGRTAESPFQIPWAGWKDIVWRTYHQIQEDRLLAIAAGVVFYGLLAIFPAITAIVSLYGLFTDPSSILDHLVLLSNVMPQEGLSIVKDQIDRVVSKGEISLSFSLAFGVILALWSANAGMKAIIDALNVVYEEEEKRGFFKLNLVSLCFTAGGVMALLSAIGAIVLAPLILDRLWYIGTGIRFAIEWGRWPILIVSVVVTLSLLYRYGPSRSTAKWRWLSVGSATAALLWLAGSAAFSFYLSSYANYDATYGSLGAVIGLMMWLWLTMVVILFGAELDSEIEHQTARDTTSGEEKRLGQRGATMADTVGPAVDGATRA